MSNSVKWELIQNSGNELSTVIEKTKEDLSSQNNSLIKISENFQNLSSTMQQIHGNIKNVFQASDDNASKSTKSAEQVSNTNEAMKKLEDRFSSVQRSLRTIDSVSNQTNLLALNATIEAARAGDAGKGFAVVAEEVKELSKSTQKVNKEIQETIEEVWALISQLSKNLIEAHDLMNQTLKSSENTKLVTQSILNLSNSMQNEIKKTKGQVDGIGQSVEKSSLQINEISVIGMTFSSIISLLKLEGVFEKLDDPLEPLEPMAAASTYFNENRFKSSEASNEIILGDDDIIISITDPKGIISFANNYFVKISEYSKEELLGTPHNILRHPDMPKSAFKYLWDTIQGKKMWQGYVKNKSKSGKFYWVKATAFPMIDQYGQIKGYISLRTKPSRQAVQRAAEIYKRLP